MNQTTTINPDPLFSVKDAAAYLSIGQTKMRQIIKTQGIPVVKVTSDPKIRKSALDQFIEQNETTIS
mgnify:CR=1 FL=1